jgi:hypothetical protein
MFEKIEFLASIIFLGHPGDEPIQILPHPECTGSIGNVKDLDTVAEFVEAGIGQIKQGQEILFGEY